MRRRGKPDEYYQDRFDFLHDEGLLKERCMCDDEYGPEGCPIHDPLYHKRSPKKDPDEAAKPGGGDPRPGRDDH
jgi:hypothetical protein